MKNKEENTKRRKTINQKEYMIDDVPANSNDIIREAKKVDNNYGVDGIYQASVAARILSQHGHTVEHNPEY